MNPSDAITIDESQIHLLFEEAGYLEAPVLNQRRVDQVLERALHEKITQDLSSFMFDGFPAVIDGMLSIASGKVNHPDDHYKA